MDSTSRDTARPPVNLQRAQLPEVAASAVEAALEDWRLNDKGRRLWAGDASLWTGADESHWLGWLDAVNDSHRLLERLDRLTDAVRREGFTDVLLLGMGGSSLCPEVLASTFGPQEGFPTLHVLDSTDPAQILSFERRVDLQRTLFLVSSKSGTTLEPNILLEYFFARVRDIVGSGAGARFLAVTDPGSHLEKVARELEFRDVFFGVPSIGGRYSALSAFGVVPAALMGLDVADFLRRAQSMVVNCAAVVPPSENPGIELGAILGCMATAGHDKVTLVSSRTLASFGGWVEQLLAESTGKLGRGLIPVDGEETGSLDEYGRDRVFVGLALDSDPDVSTIDAALDLLGRREHPVVRIGLSDRRNLAQEFFKWQVATAVAGSILEVNPFDQPDVEASKVRTRRLTEAYETTGALPAAQPFAEDREFALFTDEDNRTALEAAAGASASPPHYLRAHLDRLEPGDFLAVLAYVEMNDAHRAELQRLRHAVRRGRRVATAVEFGPRFLHSTGQAYKGGPPTGLFLQVTCDDLEDVPVPGRRYSFGVVKAAQAAGDLAVLLERRRRVVRVHLKSVPASGLAALARIADDWARDVS